VNNLLLGIDGGGTHTRAHLTDLQGDLLGAGAAGTSNPVVHGVAAAKNELEAAIAGAFAEAGISRARVAALCMGLGGAGRANEQQELVTWAQRELAERVRVVNDGQIVLAAGTPDNWGVAVIAGTGSLAWGQSPSGETARAGGWGYLIGDEGSGFDLARGALRAATRYADGRGDATALLDAILEFWNLSAPQELVGAVYRSGRTHAQLAVLAPLVVQLAEGGDTIALQLVRTAAEELARAAHAVSAALRLQARAFPLALTGGVLLGSDFYRAQLLDALAQRGAHVAPVQSVHHPVLGAVRLARHLAL
jgi:N-acetylglucosamine kinase-like BadF-type ATPase